MKKVVAAGLLAVWAGLMVPAPVFAAGPSFGQVVDHVEEGKNTRLAAKEYWNKVKGVEVSWSGTVHDVRGGSSRAKIYVADRSRPVYKGYNITVVTTDVARAAALKKGMKIRFTGRLDDFRTKRGGAIIEVDDARIQ